MRGRSVLLLLAIVLATTGCRSLQAEAGSKQATRTAATATAQAPRPTAVPKPQLGKLAFIRGGDIWAKELPDGEAKRLTTDGHNDTPRWSSSGKWTSFQKDDRTVWVTRADGSDSHEVQPGLKAQLYWSPDGRSIAYTSAPEVRTEGGNDAKAAAARRKIWVVRPDGSARHQLTNDANYRDERPQWSRDGAFILFGRFLDNEKMQLWLMRSDGSDLKQVVDELTPTPGPADAWFGYYGTVGWDSLYDWWTGPSGGLQTEKQRTAPVVP